MLNKSKNKIKGKAKGKALGYRSTPKKAVDSSHKKTSLAPSVSMEDKEAVNPSSKPFTPGVRPAAKKTVTKKARTLEHARE